MDWMQVLSIDKRHSFLAEFYIVFGPEATEKLLKIFGGVTLRIPSTWDIQTIKRDLHIYHQLRPLEGEARFAKTELLMRRYKLSIMMISKILNHMERLEKECEQIRARDYFGGGGRGYGGEKAQPHK